MTDLRSVVACFTLLLSCSGTKAEAGADVSDEEPDFSAPINNVTVALGREAILTCSVTKLNAYKVGWLKAEDQTILSMHTKVVTHNARISVTHENFRTWLLHIRQLKESDRGCYMCQINTNVMKKQLGCIDVHVPPDIIDSGTSSDVTVNEGGNATLFCKARGRPDPKIVWRRESGQLILIRSNSKEYKAETYSGDVLVLPKINRSQMGAYLCIASNDVPPAVSKRITLNVNFPPMIKISNQLLGSPVGADVTLSCVVEAYPNTINYWLKNRGQMLLSGAKHLVEEIRYTFHVTLKLTVRGFNLSDVGTYTCVATNSLGKAEGSIRLYEIKIPTTIATTTTMSTTTTRATSTTTEFTVSTTDFSFLQDSRTSTEISLEIERIITNEIDTSSVKSSGAGRNSRIPQHYLSSTSSHLYRAPFLISLCFFFHFAR